MIAKRPQSFGLLLLVAVCAACAQLARAYTLPPAGEPVTVGPSTFTHPRTQHYVSDDRNPNPDVPAEWAIVYDPTPKWSVIPIQCSMIPGTQDEFLFVYKSQNFKTRGRDVGAAVFDLSEASLAGTLGNAGAPMGVQRNISVESNPFCGHTQQLSDGRLLVVGGAEATPNNFTDGLKDVRVYDHKNNPGNLPTVAKSRDGRWYPSLTLLADSTVLIQGGTQAGKEESNGSDWLERWDPAEPEAMPLTSYPIDPDFFRIVGKNWFPMQVLLPTGDVFIMQDNQTRFLTANGEYRDVPDFPEYPDRMFANQWPRSGSMVLGALDAATDYSEVTIYVMGGVPHHNRCYYGGPDNAILASRNIWHLRMQMTLDEATGEPTYTFPDGEWKLEDMGIPRTGGDGVMTPAGDIVLVSGMQRGCHGGQGKNFAPDGSGRFTIEPRNTAPAFWPVLYQVDKPEGERVTVLAGSTIARAYHHSAALTLDGHVMVGGCDECNASSYFVEGVDAIVRDFWSPLPREQGKREHRVEVLRTPFSLDANNRPRIVSVGRNRDRTAEVTTSYGDVLTITWRADLDDVPRPDVTGVSLVAPSSTTHSYNNNQRVLKLEIVSKVSEDGEDTGTLTVRMPPNARVAPPQYYQLYLLNQKTNSRAWWVWLRA